MDIQYKSTSLKKLCVDQKQADRKFGSDIASSLRSRLADIEAAMRVGDLIAGDPHPLTGNRKGEFSIRLKRGYRLVFEACDNPAPVINERAIDWRNVRCVRITFIGDYHE